MCSLECSHEPNKAHYLLRGNIAMKNNKATYCCSRWNIPMTNTTQRVFFSLEYVHEKQHNLFCPWEYYNETTQSKLVFHGTIPMKQKQKQIVCSLEYFHEQTRKLFVHGNLPMKQQSNIVTNQQSSLLPNYRDSW